MSYQNETEDLRSKLDEERNIKVSVALFGQPGAGKSSLINKIVGRKVAEPGVETDKTVNAASYEHNGLRLVDLPGYGTKNFPKETFFDKFDIKKFDLFLCVISGKMHEADTEFFQELRNQGKICIFVVNKRDEIWQEDKSIEELEKLKADDIRKHVKHPVKVIFISCKDNFGLDALLEEISKNLEDAKSERWLRSAKAYSLDFLEQKKKACEKYVTLAAVASAANGINPIPGVDVAVDLSILTQLFKEIRKDFGLSDDFLLNLKQSSIPAVGRLATNVAKYAAKEGLLIILKSFAGRQVVKTFAKYIPFAGQAIAAGIGYKITSNVGGSYLNDCHDLAAEALKNKLKY